MDDEFEGEISVRGNPAVTAQFFYIMRAMGVATASQQELEQARTAEERSNAARRGRAALVTLRESLQRVAGLLNDPALPPDARAMFAATLASQQGMFDSVNARFEASLATHGLSDVAG